MPVIIYEMLFYLLLGLITGFISGFLGIGGGFLRIPIFTVVFAHFGVEETVLMHVIVGTSVALIVPTAIAASMKQYHLGNLDLKYYRGWALALTAGVVVGLLIVPYCSAKTFRIIFLSLVLCIIVYLGFFSHTRGITARPPTGLLKSLIALSIGLLSILTGTGGGAITTPVLKACSVPLKRAIALASATGLVIGLVGMAGFIYHGLDVAGRPHFSWGYINLLVVFSMTPTVIYGASLGARINNQCSDRSIRIAFIVLLLVIVANMLQQILA